MKKPIYLDYNATTPIAEEVAEAMKPYLEDYFGNPSSTHSYGVRTKRAVMKARKQIAELIGCSVDEIIFTSGGTESNNYALKGIAFANRSKGNHISQTIEFLPHGRGNLKCPCGQPIEKIENRCNSNQP